MHIRVSPFYIYLTYPRQALYPCESVIFLFIDKPHGQIHFNVHFRKPNLKKMYSNA